MKLLLLLFALAIVVVCNGQPERTYKFGVSLHGTFANNPGGPELNFSLIRGRSCFQAGIYQTHTSRDQHIGPHVAWQLYPFSLEHRVKHFFSIDYYYFSADLGYGGRSTSNMFNLCYGINWDLNPKFYLTGNIGGGWGSRVSESETDVIFNTVWRFGLGYHF
jgi:hypothetical protein